MRASGLYTPVLMLTARDAVSERVEALNANADGYLTKPFSIEELLARVRARLRRSGRIGREMLSFESLVVNIASREVERQGRPIQITVREYDLLLCMLRKQNRIRERNGILKEVWGGTFVGDDSPLDVYIRYLRKKVAVPGHPTLIQTVRGVFFMLQEGAVKG